MCSKLLTLLKDGPLPVNDTRLESLVSGSLFIQKIAGQCGLKNLILSCSKVTSADGKYFLCKETEQQPNVCEPYKDTDNKSVELCDVDQSAAAPVLESDLKSKSSKGHRPRLLSFVNKDPEKKPPKSHCSRNRTSIFDKMPNSGDFSALAWDVQPQLKGDKRTSNKVAQFKFSSVQGTNNEEHPHSFATAVKNNACSVSNFIDEGAQNDHNSVKGRRPAAVYDSEKLVEAIFPLDCDESKPVYVQMNNVSSYVAALNNLDVSVFDGSLPLEETGELSSFSIDHDSTNTTGNECAETSEEAGSLSPRKIDKVMESKTISELVSSGNTHNEASFGNTTNISNVTPLGTVKEVSFSKSKCSSIGSDVQKDVPDATSSCLPSIASAKLGAPSPEQQTLLEELRAEIKTIVTESKERRINFIVGKPATPDPPSVPINSPSTPIIPSVDVREESAAVGPEAHDAATRPAKMSSERKVSSTIDFQLLPDVNRNKDTSAAANHDVNHVAERSHNADYCSDQFEAADTEISNDKPATHRKLSSHLNEDDDKLPEKICFANKSVNTTSDIEKECESLAAENLSLKALVLQHQKRFKNSQNKSAFMTNNMIASIDELQTENSTLKSQNSTLMSLNRDLKEKINLESHSVESALENNETLTNENDQLQEKFRNMRDSILSESERTLVSINKRCENDEQMSEESIHKALLRGLLEVYSENRLVLSELRDQVCLLLRAVSKNPQEFNVTLFQEKYLQLWETRSLLSLIGGPKFPLKSLISDALPGSFKGKWMEFRPGHWKSVISYVTDKNIHELHDLDSPAPDSGVRTTSVDESSNSNVRKTSSCQTESGFFSDTKSPQSDHLHSPFSLGSTASSGNVNSANFEFLSKASFALREIKDLLSTGTKSNFHSVRDSIYAIICNVEGTKDKKAGEVMESSAFEISSPDCKSASGGSSSETDSFVASSVCLPILCDSVKPLPIQPLTPDPVCHTLRAADANLDPKSAVQQTKQTSTKLGCKPDPNFSCYRKLMLLKKSTRHSQLSKVTVFFFSFVFLEEQKIF